MREKGVGTARTKGGLGMWEITPELLEALKRIYQR